MLCVLLVWESSIPITNMPITSCKAVITNSFAPLRVPFNYFLSINLSIYHYHSHGPSSISRLRLLAIPGALVSSVTFLKTFLLSGMSSLENVTVQILLILQHPAQRFPSSWFSPELSVRINLSFSFIHSIIQQITMATCCMHWIKQRSCLLRAYISGKRQMLNEVNKSVNHIVNQRLISVMEKDTEQDKDWG